MNGVLLMKQSTPFPQHCWWHSSGIYLPKVYFVSYLKSLMQKARFEFLPIQHQAWSNYIILQKPVTEMTPRIFMAEKTNLQTKTPRKQNQLQHQKGEMSNPLSHAWESKTAPRSNFLNLMHHSCPARCRAGEFLCLFPTAAQCRRLWAGKRIHQSVWWVQAGTTTYKQKYL